MPRPLPSAARVPLTATDPARPARGRRRRRALFTAGAALALLVVAMARLGGSETVGAPQAVVLGAVEGVTEFLPVSSTAHLVVVERLLGLTGAAGASDALDAYAVVIQAGAILAVACLFHRRLLGAAAAVATSVGLAPFRRSARAGDRRVAVAVLVAAAPAGSVGLLAGDAVQRTLFAPVPIAGAWAVGGVALLLVARWSPAPAATAGRQGVPLELVTWQQALVVGLAQSLALWPGVSRSLVTIAAGLLVGLTVGAAVELSFLVGFVVLLAASGLELSRQGGGIVAAYGWLNPLLGMAVAFVCAAGAVRWLTTAVSAKHLAGFGCYRLAAAALTLAFVAAGWI